MPFSTIKVLQPDFSKITDVNASLYDTVAKANAVSGQSATGFTGYANGCFYPDAYATRAQLSKVIVQAHH